jgi:Zn-dependent protease with chaperone function
MVFWGYCRYSKPMVINSFKSSDYHEAFASAIKLEPHHAPGLFAEVAEQCKRANIPVIQDISLIPSKTPNASMTPLGKKKLYLSQGLLETLNSTNLNERPSRELASVISHELGHARHSAGRVLGCFALITAIPAMATGAYYFITRANKRVEMTKHADPEHPQAFWNALQTEFDIAKKDGAVETIKNWYLDRNALVDWKVTQQHFDEKDQAADVLLHNARTLAIETAAGVAAFAACRPIALADEYKCDRFAVAMTGDNKPYLSAINKLIDRTATLNAEKESSVAGKTLLKRMAGALRSFVTQTIGAHPEPADRLSYISRLKPSKLIEHFQL